MRNPIGESRRTGFTLVELLVVIAVVSVLASLLLPTMRTAREAGRRTTCAANLRQMHVGCNVYSGDWGCLPFWNWSILADRFWQRKIFPYVGYSNKVFDCPTMPPYTGWAKSVYDTTAFPGRPYAMYHIDLWCDYTCNTWTGSRAQDTSGAGYWWGPDDTSIVKWSVFRGRESHKVLYADCRHDQDCWTPGDWSYHGDKGIGEPSDGNVAWWYQIWPSYTHFEAATRHSRGGNYVFADGHGQWLPREDVWYIGNHNWKLMYLPTPNWYREDLF